MSLSPHHLERPRLSAALAARRVGLIEAGAGYGKSVLADQHRAALGIATAYAPLGAADREPGVLIGSLRRALSQARLSDLLAAAGDPEPDAWIERLLDALGASDEGVLLIVDDAHHAQSTPASEALLRLAHAIPEPHRLLIAARSFARALEPVWALPEPAHLDTESLAFTFDEAHQLLLYAGLGDPDRRELELLLDATEGWATALVLAAAARRTGSRDDPPAREVAFDPVGTPLRGILAALEPTERDVIVQLAHLPFLSPALCDLLAGREGAFETLVASGIPIARVRSGWWELPSPVAAHLLTLGPLRSETVRAAATSYWEDGEQLAALRLLSAGGLHDAAAAALAELSPARVDELGLGVVRDLIDALPRASLAAEPRPLLHLARLAETAHQNELRSAALLRVATALPGGGGPLRRELDAERARDLMWDERTRAESRRLAEEVLREAEIDELIARARALDVLGRLASWFSEIGPQPEAEARLRESAGLARLIGQPTWTAQALTALGAGYFFALCRYEEALEVLDGALAELPARHRYRAMIQSFRVDAASELGRFEEAEGAIVSMREIGGAVRENWILAYAAWAEAALASYLGDGARTVRAYRQIDRYRDEWFEQPSGGECLAQVADHLSRAGRDEEALECLARARAKMEGNERIVRVHGAAVLARSGPPEEAARAIEEALEGPAAEPHELWPLQLQRAYVTLRRGREDESKRLAVEAFEYCRELGLPRGPLIREPVLGRTLLPLAVAGGSEAAQSLSASEARETWEIRLFGTFELRRGRSPVALPPGRPTRAVQILAAVGGRIHAEALIEELWPGADLALGRNRLRNVLSRIRTAAGELLERDGEMVVLSPACEVDALQFQSSATAALAVTSGEPARAITLARAALELYRGELLPDDRYDAWAAAPRERLRLRLLEVLDLLVTAAERDGEVDEARRLLARAIDVEPADERRYLQLARLMVAQGRSGSALATLRQARAALHEAGLEPSRELGRIAESLAAGEGLRAFNTR